MKTKIPQARTCAAKQINKQTERRLDSRGTGRRPAQQSTDGDAGTEGAQQGSVAHHGSLECMRHSRGRILDRTRLEGVPHARRGSKMGIGPTLED